jgi:hypothetical protein
VNIEMIEEEQEYEITEEDKEIMRNATACRWVDVADANNIGIFLQNPCYSSF